MSDAAGTQIVSTLGPGADFRHDYEYLAGYQQRSDRALDRLLKFRRRFAEGSEQAIKQGVDAHLEPLRTRLIESPYYRRVLRQRGLSPRDLRSVDDLTAFPTLDRSTLGANWREIPVVDEDARSYRDAALVRSSGSTGAPIQVVRDGYDLVHMWTMLRFWSAVADAALPQSPIVVLLCDLPSGLEYESRLPTLDDGTLYRISTRQPRPLERLLRADPDVIFSDPAGLHWLLGQDDLPRPHLALSSAQHLGSPLRERLRSRLGCEVINYYSASESGPIAWECLEHSGRFHVLLPDVWVESVDGELVITRLRPSLVPLLRYRMGDAGRVDFDACKCGYRGWTIEAFSGRRACDFIRPDGQKVDAWGLSRLFKHRALDGFRLTQVERRIFRVELCAAQCADGQDERLRQEVSDSLVRLGWDEPRVSVEYVESLDARGGKPRAFCCEVEGQGLQPSHHPQAAARDA
jgi:phenylacetate-CoA ligase